MAQPLRDLLARGLPRSPSAVLLLVIVLGLALRLYGLQWDQGNFFHPDERSIYMRVECMHRVLSAGPDYRDCIRDYPQTRPGVPSPEVFLDAVRSPLNPHWFPLGSIIIYLLLIVKVALSPVLSMDMEDLALAGRTISALVDVGSMVMLYLLGRRLFDRRVGLLAAGLLAVSVAHIQQSHFYRPETFIVFFTLGSFWAMVRVTDQGRWRDWLLLGLFVGLTFATKVSALPLFLPLVLTFGVRWYRAGRGSPGRSVGRSLAPLAARALAAAGLAGAVFLFWTPYAVLDVGQFLADTLREADVARHPGTVPYTLQYIGTTPVLYELRQSIVWALGAPLGVVAWAGLLVAIARNVRRPRAGEVLLLAWAVLFLLVVASFPVKFLRYVFPLTPVLVLFGAWLLVWTWDAACRHRPRLAAVALALGAFVVLATVFYAFAFERVYARPHPAVQASQWVQAHIPPGSRILTDNHWDEGFPGLHQYPTTQLPMYEGDSQRKTTMLVRALAGGDYLLSYSNRLYGSIPRVPDRYPVSSRYYYALFSGELGYRLVASFTTYPELLGVAFVNDTFRRAGLPVPEGLHQRDVAPLTFNMGFADENVMDYDHPLVLVFRNVERKSAEEMADVLAQPVTSSGGAGASLSQADGVAQRAGGTWSELFAPGGWTNRLPVLAWLLVVEGIFLAALPLTLALLRPLPDRGVLMARPLGLLLVGYLAWLGPSLGWVNFSRGTIVFGLLLVALASGIVLAVQGREVLDFLRRRWRYVVAVEGLFLVAFSAFLLLRMANPDLWHPYRGGEKPMDLAYLTAVAKSTTFPPYDPWFAGGYLHYYYFGQFLVGALTRVTGIVPAVAFNLAVPLLFALTVTGAFAVAYNLTESLRRRRYPAAALWGPVAAGVAAALLVAVLGNLDGAIQLVQGAWGVLRGQGFPQFDFWRSSRMMPGQLSITEFPFWTFLFADLHAHLMVIPFALLALGLALTVVLASEKRRWGRLTALAVVLALVVGSLAAINTWETPTYLAIGVAAFAIGAVRGAGGLWRRAGLAGALAAVFVVLAFALFLPYHVSRHGLFEGLQASKWQTSFHHYLAAHGLFFVVVLGFLTIEAFRWLGPSGGPSGRSRAAVTALTLVAAAGLVGSLVAVGYATVGVLVLLLGVCLAVAMQRVRAGGPDTPLHLYVLLLLGVALAIGAGVDLVTLKGDIDRMNTVFKFYLQAWVLYAVVTACAAWYLGVSGALRPWRRLMSLKVAWISLVGLLLLSTGIYPILGTRARLADRFAVRPLTLNGAAFMDGAEYLDERGSLELKWDAEAIRWVQENIQGSPVMLEAVTSQYRWGGRISIHTGLPTVLGWPWHQIQQRGPSSAPVDQRQQEVRTIYATRDPQAALALLRRYRVSYIYVGPVEQLYYPADGLAKFRSMVVGRQLDVAYQNQRVTIYRVL